MTGAAQHGDFAINMSSFSLLFLCLVLLLSLSQLGGGFLARAENTM